MVRIKITKPVDDTAPIYVVAEPTPVRVRVPLKNVLNVIWTTDDTVELTVRIPEGRVVIMFLRQWYYFVLHGCSRSFISALS